MNWVDQINLQELRVAVAQFSGLIAVVRDDRKFTPVHSSGKPNIFIFTPSGDLKSSIKVSASCNYFLRYFDSFLNWFVLAIALIRWKMLKTD